MPLREQNIKKVAVFSVRMCLPCWPWNDIYVEERTVEKKDPGVLVWDPNARSIVRVTGVNSVSSETFHSLYPCWIPVAAEIV